MSLSLITTAVLAGVELVINNVLKLDPTSQAKLEKLNGSALSIQCISPSLELFIIVRENNFNLMSYYEDDADTTIRGEASALFGLLISKDKNQTFYSDDLEIKGNLDLIQSLQKILSDLNIDWEYHLSKFIGDIPTQTFADGLSTTNEIIRDTKNSLLMDIDEYIHEEKKLFPSNTEFETFYKAVDQLRLRIDRAEARLNNL